MWQSLVIIGLGIFISTHSLAESVSPASLTPGHFSQTATVEDDDMEVTAIISTVNGYQEKHGLLGVVWDDNFLRAFVDKRTGIVRYQVYQHIQYDGDQWRFYDAVNYQGPSGIETKQLTTVHREVIGCGGASSGCSYSEDIGFMVDERLLQQLKQLYLASYNPPWVWKIRFKSKTSYDFDTGILPAEIDGLLQRVDQYFSDHPAIHRATQAVDTEKNASKGNVASESVSTGSQLSSSSRPKLGINGGSKNELPPAVIAAIQPATLRGIYVAVVQPGSIAEAAGVRVGDDLFEFAGHQITSGKDLNDALAVADFDTDIPLRLVRAGAEIKLTLRFRSR